MIYHKTPLGQEAFKHRAPELGGKLRTAFLLFDGAREHAEVLQATSGLGVTQADVEHLMTLGFIAPMVETVQATKPLGAEALAEQGALPRAAELSPQECYIEAMQLATALTVKLGLRGFRLNLDVEAAANLDDLRALLPQIEAAVGQNAARPLIKLLHPA